MDDLSTDLREYFDLAVKPVLIEDIEEVYVIGAGRNPAAELGNRWRWRGWAVGAVVVLLVSALIALTGGGLPQASEPIGPGVTTGPTVDLTDRHETTVDRSLNLLDFRYTYPAGGSGWELYDGFRLQKSAKGPQGAEGIVYWVGYPDSSNSYNCGLAPEFFSTNRLDNLARGVAQTSGLTLTSGPRDVLVGGQPARYVGLEIAADDGCDPGYFYNWRANSGGALWDRYAVGFIVDVWIVGTYQQVPEMVIVGLTDPDYPALRNEIQQFVSSITFPAG